MSFMCFNGCGGCFMSVIFLMNRKPIKCYIPQDNQALL